MPSVMSETDFIFSLSVCLSEIGVNWHDIGIMMIARSDQVLKTVKENITRALLLPEGPR